LAEKEGVRGKLLKTKRRGAEKLQGRYCDSASSIQIGEKKGVGKLKATGIGKTLTSQATGGKNTSA